MLGSTSAITRPGGTSNPVSLTSMTDRTATRSATSRVIPGSYAAISRPELVLALSNCGPPASAAFCTLLPCS